MSAEGGSVRFREASGVGRVVLDRPPLNVLDRDGLAELERLLERAAASDTLRVLCLAGRGKAFCAGVAVEDHMPGRVGGTLRAFGRVVERLLDFPRPAVACLHGAALGGGCELALACDLVLARADAVLGQPEIRLGVFPPAAAALLPRLVGRQRALDLVLTGRPVEATEAERIGLVQRVFPADSYEAEVEAVLERLAGLSRPVARLAKRAVLEGLGRPAREAMHGAERLYLQELMGLEDPLEGLGAFLDKREPAWSDA